MSLLSYNIPHLQKYIHSRFPELGLGPKLLMEQVVNQEVHHLPNRYKLR